MQIPFRKPKPKEPTIQELAESQLFIAERMLLEAQTEEERARHNVRMLTERVERLRHCTSPAMEISGVPRQLMKVAG